MWFKLQDREHILLPIQQEEEDDNDDDGDGDGDSDGKDGSAKGAEEILFEDGE